MATSKIDKENGCATCVFWERLTEMGSGNGLKVGNCKRHAPRPARVTYWKFKEGAYPFAVWPRTFEWEWCGEGQWEDAEGR